MSTEKEKIKYLKKSSTVVRYTGDAKRFSAKIEGTVIKTTTKELSKDHSIINWFGKKNDEPTLLMERLIDNNMALPICGTKAKFVAGKELFLYKKVIDQKGKETIVQEKNEEIQKFIDDNNLNTLLFKTETDIQTLGNGYMEAIWSRDPDHSKRKIVGLHHHDASFCRLGARNTAGYSPHIYLCSDWTKPKFKGEEGDNVRKLKGYIPFQAIWDEEEKNKWKTDLQDSFVFHIKHYTPGYPHYGIPPWYGTRNWIDLANVIPAWHKNGIKNGYTVRYLIDVSEAFFANVPSEEREAAEDQLQNEIDECLSGEQNVGKSMFAIMSSELFAEKGVIRITPINLDLHDEAFSLIFNQSDGAIASGFTLPTPLAGIEKSGGISSGSEMEHSYNIYLHLHVTEPRRTLLEPLEAIFKLNGWDKEYPGLKIGIKNVELTTLDKNPSGTQTSTSA